MGRYPILELPEGRLGQFSKQRRLEAINEAISWPKGVSREAQLTTCIFQHTDGDGFKWEVVLAKPGKEAFQEKRRNPNDMFPRITRDGMDINYSESFAGIWNEFESISRTNDGVYALEMISRFVVAAAFMKSHQPDALGNWRVSTGSEMTKFYDDLERRVPCTTYIHGHVPIRVFLNMIDAIGLQEDVKYFTLANNTFPGNKGRVNNLLTTAGVSHFLCRKAPISWLIGGITRNPPGVLPITQGLIREIFPPLQ